MFTMMIAFTLVATLNGTSFTDHSFTIEPMKIVQIDYEEDLVTCEDRQGELWDFYGCEGYQEFEWISCVMDTNGTEDFVLDDMIITVI